MIACFQAVVPCLHGQAAPCPVSSGPTEGADESGHLDEFPGTGQLQKLDARDAVYRRNRTVRLYRQVTFLHKQYWPPGGFYSSKCATLCLKCSFYHGRSIHNID